MSEKWTPHGYRVTQDGRVFSVGSDWRGYGEREMSQHLNKHGYLCVRLTVNGVRKKYRVHRLVCLSFNGPPPSENHEVRHLDGIKTNNNIENLAWGTKSENAMDRQRHGTQFNPPWEDENFRESQIKAMREGWKRRAANA